MGICQNHFYFLIFVPEAHPQPNADEPLAQPQAETFELSMKLSTRDMRSATVFVMCLVSLHGFGQPLAQSSTVKTIGAVRTVESITIDGILSETVWQREGFSSFVQRNPSEGASPTERTEVWVAYDDAALYVAARMEDSAPDSIE